MIVKQYDIESLLSVLRTFTYTTEVDGETVTVNAEVFTSGQIPIATKIFLQEYGGRVADDILDDYKKGTVTAAELGGIIKTLCAQRWKHFLEMWKVNYNPIWNVDGVEVHEIVTEYGKITRMAKGVTVADEQVTAGQTELTHGHVLTEEQKTQGSNSTTYGQTLTDEQKVDAETEVEYGQKLTDEQKVDGETSITYGKETTTTNPTSTGSVAAFDSVGFVGASQSSATNTVNTDDGTDSTTTSIGKVEHANSGTDTTTSSIGKVEHATSGTDTTTTSIGKIEHADTGKDTTTTSMGKITHSTTGTDTDTLEGSDTTTDTLTRHGNIGVTMTQQLLTAESDFWGHYSFFEKYFNDIANVISLPIYE
mgnify:CR=1 FL=1